MNHFQIAADYVTDDGYYPFAELNDQDVELDAKDVVRIFVELNLDITGQSMVEFNVGDVDRLFAELNMEGVVQPIAERDVGLKTDSPSVFNRNTDTFLTEHNHPDVAYVVGDIVMDRCFPFLVHIMQPFKSLVCNFCCLFNNILVECECKIVFHCDELCRQRDLERGHEVECQSSCFRGYCQEGVQSSRRQFVFKLYSILAMNPNFCQTKFELNNGKVCHFYDMIPRPECLGQTEVGVREVRAMAAQINASHPECTIVPDDVIYFDSLISTYGFPIFDDRHGSIYAWGLYFEPTSLSHSCTPNARYSNDGLKLRVLAIGPIPKNEQPTIGRINSFKNFKDRTTILKRSYNFTCDCPLCKFEMCGVEKVRYDLVGAKINYFEKLCHLPEITETWKSIYGSHKLILRTFRQLYHEYDPRITRQLCRNFNVVLRTNDAPQHRVGEILTESLDHLRQTYGEKHPYYVNFKDVAKKTFAGRFLKSKNG